MSDKLLYHCRVCGVECSGHPIKELPNGDEVGVQAVCAEHCEDHDYYYDPLRRGRFCQHCDSEKDPTP